MKKQPLFPRCSKLFACLLLFSTFTFIGHTQVQQKKWALNGQEIDFSSGNPVVNDLPSSLPLPSFPNGHGAANSFYGPDGNLLFYIISNNFFQRRGLP